MAQKIKIFNRFMIESQTCSIGDKYIISNSKDIRMDKSYNIRFRIYILIVPNKLGFE